MEWFLYDRVKELKNIETEIHEKLGFLLEKYKLITHE